ncbi:alpha/beta hydrolase [Nakamurella antarctica]|nr:alpha/beta fold hydrolase [Nakamurella antarctica]
MTKPETSAATTEMHQISIHTADGVTLRGISSTRGADQQPREADRICFVICHGMTNATHKPNTRSVIDAFSAFGAVVAVDFRGHGSSEGRSSVGQIEVLDVDAAISQARREGHTTVVLVGFSMGAAVALRHAGLAARATSEMGFPLRNAADAVVSVSAPSRWFSRESTPMRRIQWLLEHPFGPLIGPRLGIRLGKPWVQVPLTPLELVGSIAPTPLLIVHGTSDHYFAADRARELHKAAPASELWLIPGMGHAESGISAATITEIAQWARRAVENASIL